MDIVEAIIGFLIPELEYLCGTVSKPSGQPAPGSDVEKGLKYSHKRLGNKVLASPACTTVFMAVRARAQSAQARESAEVGGAQPKGKRQKGPCNNCTEPSAKERKTTVEANFPKESEHSKLSQTDQRRMEQNIFSTHSTNSLVVNCDPSWIAALEAEFIKEYFLKLISFVDEARKMGLVYPSPEQVFAWTLACPIESVKVVIIGQDPYHGPNQAHGLCFSVLPGIKPPPSLKNMYKELESDIPGFKTPDHGNLIGWAQQGVLLLNACLTVQAGQANSHAGQGWEKFTDAVIQWINTNLTGVVFLLWGAYAQKKGACIDKTKHHILTAAHPSPLSAHCGFFGCKHFSKCNELLTAGDKIQIYWNYLP